MADLVALLDTIDTVTAECVLCGEPRSNSLSQDFCSEDCQQRWQYIHLADPGEINKEALAAAIEQHYPELEVPKSDWKAWPMIIWSLPRHCPHCGTLLALGETADGNWGWMGLGEAYEWEPGKLRLRTKWHLPSRCQVQYQPEASQ